MEREPGAWGITGPPCHCGDINTETWSFWLGVGCKANDLALYESYCCKIQRSENWITNVAESSKGGCGSKRGVLPMMAMVVVMMMKKKIMMMMVTMMMMMMVMMMMMMMMY
jgi:hypothetical protein